MGEKRKAIRVWMLGGFRVSVGSKTIPQDAWRLKKSATLVKLLALAPGHRVHREQVMDLLWRDLGRKAASNNLRKTLHAARKVLDPDAGSRYVGSEGESLVLCPAGELWVDVDAFEDAAAIARRSHDPAAYRVAIELYAGDLLSEDRYEEWAEDRRNGLRQLHLALLLELAGLHEGREEHALAIEALRKATSEEPALEEAHAFLMRLHALSGRPEQALAQYERLRDVLSRGLGTEPGSAARRLRDEIATGRFSPTPSAGYAQKELHTTSKHNLPALRTSFVGREQEMQEIKRELAMTGLLTLTGEGGSGKTRLALEVAKDLVGGAYPDGVWLVELAPLSEGGLVPKALADALNVPERPAKPLSETLVEFLQDRHLLLVLDNCEHLMEDIAWLVAAFLDACPYLRVLATSREAWRISHEARWIVPMLSTPAPESSPTVGELEGYESVRLFVDRAHQRNPAFALGSDNACAVAEICERLDGLPLAIELAAARTRLLPPQALLSRLGNRLKLLTGGARNLPERQRTLRNTIEWSYEMLDEGEKTLFARLALSPVVAPSRR